MPSPFTPASIPSSSGLITQLFSSTLGANAANIDTGVLSAGGVHLYAVMLLRTTEAVALSTANITVNANVGGNYDLQLLQGTNVTASAALVTSGTNWQVNVPGATALASLAGFVYLDIPFYTATSFLKGGTLRLADVGDTGANYRSSLFGLTFRTAGAITQLTVTAGSGNLLAGSALAVYGVG